MKLKILPLILAFVGSASLLFGGWFIYHSVAMENPLNQALAETPGVISHTVRLDSDKTVFQVELSPQANLREVVSEVEKKNSQVAGNRKAVIQISSSTSPDLDAWWAKAMFGVAQAMETSRYTDIPAVLQQSGDSAGLQVETEMDDANVYVRLIQDGHAKFILLPRQAAKLGVWSNE